MSAVGIYDGCSEGTRKRTPGQRTRVSGALWPADDTLRSARHRHSLREDRARHRATLRHKRVGPHTIRHTTATHLLRAGVDINTIRAWLGHVSIDTTNIYAESDLEMKAKALGMCEAKLPRDRRRWRDNPDLLTFLAQL